ncbi:HDOD domain-containing protein [bacterium]|nr:HDOD domain-containing protein [bacterium]
MTVTFNNDKSSSEDEYNVFIRKIEDLPTLPYILMKIWKLVDSPDTSSKNLEEVISLDQALTAKVIRLANSPFYHIPFRVNNVKDAIVNIGFDAVKNLSIAVSVTSFFKKSERSGGYFPLKDFWRHCVGVGVVSRYIAEKVEGIDYELCFCSGILHDIGKFALNILFPQRFGEVLQRAAKEKSRIHKIEKEIFKFDHSYFGKELAKYWNFGDDLISIIGDHHKPVDEIDENLRIETSVIKVADSIVRQIKFGFSGDFLDDTFDDRALELLALDRERLKVLIPEIKKEIELASQIINLV